MKKVFEKIFTYQIQIIELVEKDSKRVFEIHVQKSGGKLEHDEEKKGKY